MSKKKPIFEVSNAEKKIGEHNNQSIKSAQVDESYPSSNQEISDGVFESVVEYVRLDSEFQVLNRWYVRPGGECLYQVGSSYKSLLDFS